MNQKSNKDIKQNESENTKQSESKNSLLLIENEVGRIFGYVEVTFWKLSQEYNYANR